MKRFLLLALLLVGFADLCSAQTVSLNEIRFGNWTDDDWYDNAYFQQVRTLLNDPETLKAEYPDLKPHLQLLRSPFVVVDAQEAVFGGLFVDFVFPKSPNHHFRAWVYGVVENNKVTDYEVRYLALEDDECPLTGEAIASAMKREPRLKLW